ncbi:MFS transporter [Singulisphaera acidiphila]|uniref:Arabinose efflux permease family protein n=1 Tax=Singulisphaera acidiphila (strain ATCC BAA-1392 / DSM 18658 / VKM B-2454 / MOB10) TaxID=886293 RepID=L0D9D1_SINAD|nr:MFS transporter [Singulisphaera acidiphila]AGA25470.1 arabinose efflux permease family protein [Singulisphaera acidiphila DSM 18658]
MQLTQDASATRTSFIDQIGIYPPLFWGYVGLLLFMIGDGVESGFLSSYLVERGLSKERVALIFTVYGLTAAIAAWLSGALSDLWGPRQVMGIGLVIWIIFEVAFLVFGVAPASYLHLLTTFALRGFGYPLFAFGFLVWVTAATPPARLGTAVGWFWFAFTGGLPTLGSLFASYSIPIIGHYATLWASLGLVVLGGLIALIGLREPTGRQRLAPPDEKPLSTLISSVSIAWRKPKTAIGCIVRVINTAPQFGFLVFLPLYFTKTIGFSEGQWLRLLSAIFLSNIIWNLLFGIIGDKFGWRRTVALCGGVGSAITTLMLYYTPHALGANYPLTVLAGILYGATLAGYVPLSALMPSLAPENKGAAMSILNLGAGASVWVGPAIVAVFLTPLGVGGVMWIFAGLYMLSAVLTLFLTLPNDKPTPISLSTSEDL